MLPMLYEETKNLVPGVYCLITNLSILSFMRRMTSPSF
jgi:hypothetical protein